MLHNCTHIVYKDIPAGNGVKCMQKQFVPNLEGTIYKYIIHVSKHTIPQAVYVLPPPPPPPPKKKDILRSPETGDTILAETPVKYTFDFTHVCVHC